MNDWINQWTIHSDSELESEPELESESELESEPFLLLSINT